MNEILKEQLQEIFLAMARGAARKKIYAMRARQEGNKALASLFNAISNSESAQASRFLIQLRGQTGSNGQNCTLAFTDEIPASIKLYEQTTQLAGDSQEKAMHSACSQSARVQSEPAEETEKERESKRREYGQLSRLPILRIYHGRQGPGALPYLHRPGQSFPGGHCLNRLNLIGTACIPVITHLTNKKARNSFKLRA